jgi:hypothetical protein
MTEAISPIIVDLGKKKKKVIRAFKKGRGRAMDEVEQAIEEVRSGLGAEADGKTIVPVVLLYRKKVKRRRRRGLFRL